MTNKKSKQLFQRAQKKLVGGVNSPVRAFKSVGGDPVFVTQGKGAVLRDADGNSYLDFVGSWGPLILGHAHPSVQSAVKRSAARGFSFGAPTELEINLADLVCSAFPSIEKVRFVSSGTEAVMTAVRLARGFTGRDKIVKFAGCYHGHSDGMLVKAGSGAATLGIPDSAGVPKSYSECTVVLPYNDADAVEQCFNKIGRQIAAVIVEPVVGNMGVVTPQQNYLQTLRKVTRKYGALLIFDEVITGFRLGWGGAQGLFRIRPDITCMGKILGGGFPVGALGGPANIMAKLAPLGPVYQAGTLSGNPVAMSAGIATLETLRKLIPWGKMEARARNLAESIRASARRHGLPVTVNQFGSMWTVFFTNEPVYDYDSAKKSDTKQYARFFHLLLDQGMYMPPAQFEAAFVSAVHTDAQMAQAASKIDRAFREMSRK